MKLLVLGLDTSAKTCSVALLNGKEVTAEYTQNLPRTHSEKLMPLVDSIFKDTGRSPGELDAVAVSCGPGSFTGLRIGVATARAMAQGLQIPAMGICTLEVMARGVYSYGSLICPVMDARRSQVYTALYSFKEKSGELQELHEPAALSLDYLKDVLQDYREPVIFLGDGLLSYGQELKEALGERFLEPASPLVYPRASLVAWGARERLLYGRGITSYLELKPLYLRASEAERK